MQDKLVKLYLEKIYGQKIDKYDLELDKLIFKEIARCEEANDQLRDQWGNWEFSYNKSFIEGNLFKPWLDYKIINTYGNISNIWPNNKKFAVCLTHDMDVVPMKKLYFYLRMCKYKLLYESSTKEKVIGFIKAFRQVLKNVNNKYDKIDFKEWIDLEDYYGFHSTFFIFPSIVTYRSVNDCIYKYSDEIYFDNKLISVADMVKTIDSLGWEIGLHGSIISANKPNVLIEQKNELERIIGHKIISIRHHYLTYDINITPSLQEQAGFLVDSTQGFNRSVGFRAGTSFPYPVFDNLNNKILNLWQVSQQIMDGAIFAANSLELDEEHAKKVINKFLDEVENVNGCLCVSWHPNYLNNKKWFNVYKFILEESKNRNAWGCSVGELYNYWLIKRMV